MTATLSPPPAPTPTPQPVPEVTPRRGPNWRKIAIALGRTLVAVGGAIVIFGAFMQMKGANPIDAYRSMWESTLQSSDSIEQILVKATPLIFAALAVTVPARAGLVNVGGEGQLVMGGVGGAAVVQWLGTGLPIGLALPLMALGGIIGGALFAGIAALLKLKFDINEAVSTLLLNYVAVDVMLFLIYDAWKDPHGSGQPATAPVPTNEQLPLIGNSSVHLGFVLAIVATGLVWFALTRTSWGFKLSVVGGNPEAARQAGLKVGLLLLSAMLVGGALAGLGGFTQLAGVEHKLRPGYLLTYGYIGFLASWLARHHPIRVALAATLLAAIAVGGDSLQLDSALPAASVNVLMALVLLGVFGWGGKRKAVAA
ncbi:MAG: ABC transporter permease [Acidimicrobiia bacterium]